jgi:hypothetical protein
LPIWLEVRSPLAVPDSSLAKLDAVERDAITLAKELHADQLKSSMTAKGNEKRSDAASS